MAQRANLKAINSD